MFESEGCPVLQSSLNSLAVMDLQFVKMSEFFSHRGFVFLILLSLGIRPQVTH